MKLKIIKSAEKRPTTAPQKKSRTKTNKLNNNICFFKYLNCCIMGNIKGGDFSE